MHKSILPPTQDDQHGYNAVIRGHYLPQTIDQPTTDSTRAVATVKSSSQTLITVPTDVPNTDTSLMFLMLFSEPGTILRSYLRGPAAEWYYYLAYRGSNDPITTDLFQTSQLNAASYAVSAQTTSLLTNYSSGQIYGAQLTQVPTTLQTFNPTNMELWKRNPQTSIVTASLEDGLIAFAPLPSKEQYLSRYATANGTTLGQVRTMVTVKSQQYSTFNTNSNPTYFGYNIVPVPTGAPPYAVVAHIPAVELSQFTRLLGIYRARIKIIFKTTVAPTQVTIGVAQNTVNFATTPPSLQKFNYLSLPNPAFDSVGALATLEEFVTVDIVNNMNGIYIQGIFNVATTILSAVIELSSLNSVTDEISQPCSMFMMINPSAQTQFLVQGVQSYSYVPAAQNINLTTTKLSHPSLQIDIEAAQGFIDSMVHEGGYDDVMPLKVFNKMVLDLPSISERNSMSRYAKINWTRVRQIAANVGYAALPILNTALPESIPFNPLIGRALKMVGGRDYVPRFAAINITTSTTWIEDLTMFGCVESNPGPQSWFRYAATILGCCSSLEVPTSHQLEAAAAGNMAGALVKRPIVQTPEGHYVVDCSQQQESSSIGALDLVMMDVQEIIERRRMQRQYEYENEGRDSVSQAQIEQGSDQNMTEEKVDNHGPVQIDMDSSMAALLTSEEDKVSFHFNDTQSVQSEQINTNRRQQDKSDSKCLSQHTPNFFKNINGQVTDDEFRQLQQELGQLNSDEQQLLRGIYQAARSVPPEEVQQCVKDLIDRVCQIIETQPVSDQESAEPVSSTQLTHTVVNGSETHAIKEESVKDQSVQSNQSFELDTELFPKRLAQMHKQNQYVHNTKSFINLDNDSQYSGSAIYEDGFTSQAPQRNTKPALHNYQQKFDFLLGKTDSLESFLTTRGGAKIGKASRIAMTEMNSYYRPKPGWSGFNEVFEEMAIPASTLMAKYEDLIEFPNPNRSGYSQRTFATIDSAYTDYEEVQVCVTQENVPYQSGFSTTLKRVAGMPLVRIQGWTEDEPSILQAVTTTIYKSLQYAKQFPLDVKSVVTIFFKKLVRNKTTGEDGEVMELALKGVSWTAAFVSMMFQKSALILYAGVIFWTNGFINHGFYGEYDSANGYTMSAALAGKLRGWLKYSTKDIAFFSVDNNDVEMWNGIFTQSVELKQAYVNVTSYVRAQGVKRLLLPANLQALDFMPVQAAAQENANLAATYYQGFSNLPEADKGFAKLLKKLESNKSMSVINDMVSYLPVPHYILAGLGQDGSLGYVDAAEKRKLKNPYLTQLESVTGLGKVNIGDPAFAKQCIEIMEGQEITDVTPEQLAFIRLVEFGEKHAAIMKGLISYLGLMYSQTSQPVAFVKQLGLMTNDQLLAKATDMQKNIQSRAEGKTDDGKKKAEEAKTQQTKKGPPPRQREQKETPQATPQGVINLDEEESKQQQPNKKDKTASFFGQVLGY